MSGQQYALHLSSRLLVEVLSDEVEYWRVRPVGSATPRRWSRAFVEREVHPVASDGFRVLEHQHPERVARWLQNPDEKLLRVILRDELARGRDGLKRQALRGYLEDYLAGEPLESLLTTLGDRLEDSPHFSTRGERSDRVYVLDTSGAAEGGVQQRLKELGLFSSKELKEPINHQQIDERVMSLVQGYRDGLQSEIADAALLGRVVAQGEGVVGHDAREAAGELLADLLQTMDAWGHFGNINTPAQRATLARIEDPLILSRALWHPALHRRAREDVALRLLRGGTSPVILRGTPPPKAADLDRIRAIDEALGCMPPAFRPAAAPTAMHHLAQIPLPFERVPTPEAFVEVLRGEPLPRLLDWIVECLQNLSLRDSHLLDWSEHLLGLAGGGRRYLKPTVEALATGAELLNITRGFAAPFRKYSEVGSLTERSKAWLHRTHDNPADRDRRGGFAARARQTDTPEGEARRKSAATFLEQVEKAWDWEQLKAEYLRAVLAIEQAVAARDEALAQARDPEHVRHLLREEQRTDIEDLRGQLMKEVERDHEERFTELNQKAASTLAQTLTAIQTILFNLPEENQAARSLSSLERRMDRLLRRMGWSTIGRFWEEVTPVDPALHEIDGPPSGTPRLATVGIRDASGKVLLRARVIRKERKLDS